MGITIRSKNFSDDMGYGGFMNFRKRVAMCVSDNFGNHYAKLSDGMLLYGDERDEYFKVYDKETNNFVECNLVSSEIANFCYQSDCEGEIDQEQSKHIYEAIKDYDDDFCYGYSGRSDCVMFEDLKDMFKDCADNGGEIKWR